VDFEGRIDPSLIFGVMNIRKVYRLPVTVYSLQFTVYSLRFVVCRFWLTDDG